MSKKKKRKNAESGHKPELIAGDIPVQELESVERQRQKTRTNGEYHLRVRRRVRRMRPRISPKNPFIPCSETLSLPLKGWGRNTEVSGDQVGECHENLSQVDERSGKPRMKCVQPSKRINCSAPPNSLSKHEG
jgi:hypothetical protein